VHVSLGNQLCTVQGWVAELNIEQGVQWHFAQQSTAHMPPVSCPDPLASAAADELAEDGVDAVAHPTQHGAPARMQVALRTALGGQQLQAVQLPLGSCCGRLFDA